MKFLKFAKIIFIIMLAPFVANAAYAQVFAEVDLSARSVYVQQSFRVTITVYTETWFTAPLEFGNLQIPNAFIIPFDKTQPGMFTIRGKQYPGVQFYYIVFPYHVGKFTVPPLQITAQSPPQGSSKTQKIVLETASHPFEVKDIPEELKKNGSWFVAKNVVLYDKLSPDSRKFKVGDVVKRTITIDASGTLPQFIPEPIGHEKIDPVSVYPRDPILTDTRNERDVNGRSVQTVTYLLEKPGDLTLPGVRLSFWNPVTSRSETKSTQPIRLHVDENPDLGILATLKDSLNAAVEIAPTKSGIEKPFLILGLSPYAFGGGVIITVGLTYFLVRTGKRVFANIRRKREKRKKSEAYLFDRVLRSTDDSDKFLPALYRWWDRFRGTSSASVGAALDTGGFANESKTFKDYYEEALHGKKTDETKKIKETLKAFRTKSKEKQPDKDDFFPI